jgi:hypothetical protein
MNDAVRDYVEETTRVWIGLPRAAEVPALPDPLARRFLRLEEVERPHRDQWGCWEASFGESFRDGRLWEPDVDAWVAARRAELAAPVALEPLWPEGKPFAVCLTHDVDLVSSSLTPAQAVRSLRASLGGPGDGALRFARPPVRAARALRHGLARAPRAEMLELSVEVERERGVSASYFFTVYPPEPSRYDCLYVPDDRCTFRGRRQRVADVLVTLAGEGFDVGLHGSYHSALVPGLLEAERTRLEQATGLDVRTTRQHFLHWALETTPRLQAEAGLRADSTVGFNRNVGFRAGTALPYRQLDVASGTRLGLLEVPLVIHDGPLLRGDGLELDVGLARETVHTLIDRVAATGGVATLLFHPNNLERPEFLELYRDAIDYGLAAGAWFASLREIEAWWREREERLG